MLTLALKERRMDCNKIFNTKTVEIKRQSSFKTHLTHTHTEERKMNLHFGWENLWQEAYIFFWKL